MTIFGLTIMKYSEYMKLVNHDIVMSAEIASYKEIAKKQDALIREQEKELNTLQLAYDKITDRDDKGRFKK